MSTKATWVTEDFPAHGTCEGIFTRVDFLMGRQVGAVREALSTLGAFIGFLAGQRLFLLVGPFVSAKATGVKEASSTNRAYKWLLAPVDFLVGDKAAMPKEVLPTF